MKKNKKYIILLILLILLIYWYANLNYKNFFSKKNKLIEFNNNNLIKNDLLVYTLADIKITGDTKFNNKKILNLIDLKIGDKIYKDKFSTFLKKLHNNGFFSDIHIYIDNIINNNIYLNFFLKKKNLPSIYNIELIGIKLYEFKEILNNFLYKKFFYKNGVYQIPMSNFWISYVKILIKKFFLKKGYNNVNIIFTIKNNQLFINVNKGKINEIKEILFEGNKILSDRKLLSLMKETKKSFNLKNFNFNFKNKSIFIKNKYELDKINIINYYKSLGYIDAKIIKDNIDKTYDDYIIHIKIYEGKKYYVNNIYFNGNKNINQLYLIDVLNFNKGDVYNLNYIKNNIINNITSLYLKKGYLFCNINFSEKIVDNKIDLFIDIKEGPLMTFNKINISGNLKTKDNVIMRRITTLPGEIFSKEEIKNTFNNLKELGDLDKNSPYIKYNNNNTVDLDWNFLEKRNSKIKLEGGLVNKHITGTVTLNINNFSISDFLKKRDSFNFIPKGDGEYLSLYKKIGLNNSIGFLWSKPLSKSTILIKYDKSNNNSIFSKSYSLGMNNIINKYSNINLSFNCDYSNNKSLYDIYLMLKFKRDSLINKIFPISGSIFEINTTLTPPYSLIRNNSFHEYFKIKSSIFWYKKLFSTFVTKIGSEFGFNNDLKSNKFNSIRGYNSNNMGGIIFNKFIIEIYLPFIFYDQIKIWGLGFLEGGNTYKSYYEYNPFKLNRSIGTGIRLYIPILGVVGIDIGYGFDNNNSKWKINYLLEK
ncbi:MAG: hypothetical protein NHF94_00755 [Candidatus Bostrichicola ureolyticus]|nr:MAG: hypothetical protein NHF94_00755 [Candidatus Bostrichicola ureolyticus]